MRPIWRGERARRGPTSSAILRKHECGLEEESLRSVKQDYGGKKVAQNKCFVRQVKAHVAEQRKKHMNAKGTSNTAEKILLEPNLTSQTCKRQARNK